MKLSFKQYLITEKANKSELDEILNDKNNLIGIEFEYFDNNIKGHGHGGSGYSQEELVSEYNSLMDEIDEYLNDYRTELSDWQEENSQLIRDKKKELQDKLEEKTEELSTLESNLNDAEELVDSTQDETIDAETEVEKLESKISEIEDNISSKKEEIDEAGDDDIDKLNTELDELEDSLVETQNERDNAEIKFSDLQGELGNHEDEVISLQNQISDLESDVYELDDTLDIFSDFDGEYSHHTYETFSEYVDDLEEDFEFTQYGPTIPTNLMDYWSNFHNENSINQSFNEALYTAMYDEDYFSTPDEFTNPEYDESDVDFYELISDNFNFDDFPFDGTEIEGSDNKKWTIVPDGSLDLNEGGVEIVSPIMTLKAGLGAMYKMFDFIYDNGSTSGETGLHINASYKKVDSSKIDVMKMVLFSDENVINKFFPNREHSSYAKKMQKNLNQNVVSEQDDIIKAVNDNIKNFKDLTSLQKDISPLLELEATKYNAINTKNMNFKNGRVEFRYLGGANYHEQFDVIKRFVLYFFYLIKLGTDPDYKRKEYIQKLWKLIDPDKVKGKAIQSQSDNQIETIIGFINNTKNVITIDPQSETIFIAEEQPHKGKELSLVVNKKMTQKEFLRFYKTNKSKITIVGDIDIRNPHKSLKIRSKLSPYKDKSKPNNILLNKQIKFGDRMVDYSIKHNDDNFYFIGETYDRNSKNRNRKDIYKAIKEVHYISRNKDGKIEETTLNILTTNTHFIRYIK